MKKIAIIGVTASGKTTLANKLSKILDISVYHLDKIGWKGNNKEFASQAEIIEKVREILNKPSWIIDGSMPRSKVLDMRLKRADTIIFYDFPIFINLWRQTKRFFKYFNKIRPDMDGDRKQKYPFTLRSIKYNLNYPVKDIYSKIEPYLNSKNVYFVKSLKDEKFLIEFFSNSRF